MKKIGIITFSWAHNYGALLQTFALQENLLINNNDVKIINYITRENKKQYSPYRLSSNIRGNITNMLFLPKAIKKNFKFRKFIHKNLLLTKQYYGFKQLYKNAPEFDIYITGSDQVWNPKITKGLSDAYTLNFGENNIKRISYAASVGDATLINANKEIFKTKLKKIDKISVREDDAKLELQKIIKKNIEIVLDPTLLLSREQWDKKVGESKKQKEKYILAYVVEEDPEYKKIVNYLSEKTGLKVIHFERRKSKYNSVLKTAYTEDPFEFVNLIKNAEYVVATSFHATVFSIIYNKKFFIVPHKKTGARVINLLNKLNIVGRNFDTFEEFKNIDYNLNTDWEKVNKKLEEERKKSIDWLKNAIK